jgi:hypothetical protein
VVALAARRRATPGRFLDREYEQWRRILTELGLANNIC